MFATTVLCFFSSKAVDLTSYLLDVAEESLQLKKAGNELKDSQGVQEYKFRFTTTEWEELKTTDQPDVLIMLLLQACDSPSGEVSKEMTFMEGDFLRLVQGEAFTTAKEQREILRYAVWRNAMHKKAGFK